jgi:hypothetical protein
MDSRRVIPALQCSDVPTDDISARDIHPSMSGGRRTTGHRDFLEGTALSMSNV